MNQKIKGILFPNKYNLSVFLLLYLVAIIIPVLKGGSDHLPYYYRNILSMLFAPFWNTSLPAGAWMLRLFIIFGMSGFYLYFISVFFGAILKYRSITGLKNIVSDSKIRILFLIIFLILFISFGGITQIKKFINPPEIPCMCPQEVGYPCPTFCGYYPRESFIIATILIATSSTVTSFLISCFIFIVKNCDKE